ncbi:MAG: hypothetical protein IT242_07240 [Bacteroidia bacterium]|nr:hypothetical protein [Bacteroidia bacterium]
MKQLSTFNKVFIFFWLVIITLIIVKAPHENEKTDQKTSIPKVAYGNH